MWHVTLSNMADEEGVEKVCSFLKSRNVKEEVIENFRKEKMDLEAVKQSSDDLLKSLGLNCSGDRLNLRRFCQNKNSEENDNKDRKRKLLEAFFEKRAGKKPLKPKVDEKEKTKKKIQLGWMHFNVEKNKFISVRLAKGGGTRDVEVLPSASKEHLIDEAKSLFFPNGYNEIAGPASESELGLANFKGKPIENTLIVGSEVLPFNIERYADVNKLNKVRLYLTSKKKLPSYESISDESASETSEVLDEVSFQDTPSSIANATSTSERELIIKEQDEAYAQSLAKDKAKEEIKRDSLEKDKAEEEEKKEIAERKESLRQKRLLRVPTEPTDSTSARVIVQVRHPMLGIVRRNFNILDQMLSIYDWVGSLSTDPEHFELYLPTGQMVEPSMPVTEADRVTLFMTETDCCPRLSKEDPDVQFQGFGEASVLSISEQVPTRLMVEDSDDGEDTSAVQSIPSTASTDDQEMTYASGRRFRQLLNSGYFDLQGSSNSQEQEDESEDEVNLEETPLLVPLQVERILSIRRVNVMKDMINAFSSDPLLLHSTVKIVMINGQGKAESGMDNGGVFRDALSAFWQEVYDSSTVGEEERVPCLRHDFKQNEWEAVGRIMVKGFVQLGYFPFKISKCMMIATIFGEDQVDGDMLLSSFMGYLSKDERDLVKSAMENKLDAEQQDEWLDFLERFSCKRVLQQPEQVKELVMELAHKELIQGPKYVIDSWRRPCIQLKQLQDFKSVSSLTSLYDRIIPTNRKVMALFSAAPSSGAERDSYGYLQRYIRGLDNAMLLKFLRYCTGADVLCTKTITVNFTAMDGVGRRPAAHTCGPLLELPRTYVSFPNFREEMNNILNSGMWDIDFV